MKFRNLSTVIGNWYHIIEECFSLKLFVKASMFCAIAILIDYAIRPDAFERVLDWKWFFVSTTLPAAELLLFALVWVLPAPFAKKTEPSDKILGPFLCKPTSGSMGFWVASWHPCTSIRIKVFLNKKEFEDVPLKLVSAKFNTWLGETTLPLNQNTEFTYQLLIDGTPVQRPWQNDLRFKVLPEGKNADLNLASMSCHGIDAWEKKHGTLKTFNMWNRLYQRLLKEDIALAVLGGDQVYMDEQFESRIAKYQDLTSEEKIFLIKEVYFQYWSHPSYQRILARIPSILMWDDHDINDGFGSRPDSFKSGKTELADNWKNYFIDLKEAFVAFQAVRNPNTNLEDANLSFVWDLPQLRLLALDLRSERNIRERRMLSAAAKSAIEDKLRMPSEKPLFIVSPVTVTRIAGGIEDFLGQFANTIWRYTRWFGYSPSFIKVLFWLTLFIVSFVCLQLTEVTATDTSKADHLSNILCGVFLVIASGYAGFANIVRKVMGEKSDIAGAPLKWIRGGIVAVFIVGIIGVLWEVRGNGIQLSIAEAVTIIRKYMIADGHSLLLLLAPLVISLTLLFDSKRITQKKNKSIAHIIGYSLLAIFFVFLLWFGLPGTHLNINFALKIPVAILSFFFLVTAILESLGAVDEIAGLDDDIKDSWSSIQNESSLEWLSSLMKKTRGPVYLLCGDIHTGGISNINIGKIVPQITSSPISYTPMPSFAEKATSGSSRMNLPRGKQRATAKNVFFISERNFVNVKVTNGTVAVQFCFEDHRKDVFMKL